MGLTVSGLSDYTNENKMELVTKSLLGGKTLSLINVQADIKSSAAINILEGDAVFQAGACGWNASGTTTLTQRVITVAKFKQNEGICVDELEAKYIQTQMKVGSYTEEMPFEKIYAEEKSSKSAKAVESIAWQGDTTGSGNLALTDGFIKIIDAEGTVVTGTTELLAAGTIIAAVNDMVASVPYDVIESTDLTLFMGYEKYRMYIAALKAANMYHVPAVEGNNFEYVIQGTNITIKAVAGLNNTGVAGAGRIFLCEESNLFVGTDLMNDQDDFKIYWSEDNDEVRFKQKFKLGFQIAFPERIVSN